MQNAEIVLSILNQKSKEDNNYKFKRLYRNLFNPDLYLNAYAKIYSKEGNMTQGVDGETIDGFSIKTVNNLIEKLRHERYTPNPVRRKYIPKKNGKKRPLGIPTIKDKLVQEVVKQLLEAIYEPQFNYTSHGFRPNRSCHTALYQIRRYGNGTSWIIEGDIKGFFDNINHDKMLEILKSKIEDGRFINLIKKFLEAGIMEEGKIRDSITGTPQGGIVSPLLANIYLNELDKYMENLKLTKDKGKTRKKNRVYDRLSWARGREKRNGNYEKANDLLKKMQRIPALDPMDPGFRSIEYVRYADDFVILIRGAKLFAEEIKLDISNFLARFLKLELSEEKTLITNPLKDKARFLGYEIIKAKNDTKITKNKIGIKMRSINGAIQLLVPADVIKNKIKPFTRKGKSFHKSELLNYGHAEIIKKYNSEIRGLYNYYSLAVNVGKRLWHFKYFHYYSLVKTIAYKHKITGTKAIRKYGITIKRKCGTGTMNIIGTKYTKKNGEVKILTYYSYPLVYNKTPKYKHILPETNYKKNYKNEIIRRLLNGFCELCGKEIPHDQLEVHHVRNLKKLREKYKNKNGDTPAWVKLMLKIYRKTIVVCNHCHRKKIHR